MFGFDRPAVYTFSDLTRLNHLFKMIYTTLKSDRLYGNYYASGFAYDYLVEFYRLANNKSTAEESESNQTMITAVNYIDSHIKEEITLDQLSQATGVTKQHLCKLFKRNFQTTPIEYITKIKLHHSKHLLLTTDLTVKVISETLGFSDCGYFCRVFKRYELMSPLEYKKTSYK